MSFDFNFTVQIILVLNFCYSVMIISIVISIMEISILIVNMTDDFTSHDLILEILVHQLWLAHTKACKCLAPRHSTVRKVTQCCSYSLHNVDIKLQECPHLKGANKILIV